MGLALGVNHLDCIKWVRLYPKVLNAHSRSHLHRMADCIKFHPKNLSPLNCPPESPKRMAEKVPCYRSRSSLYCYWTVCAHFCFRRVRRRVRFRHRWLSRVTMHSPKQSEKGVSKPIRLIWEEIECSLSLTSLTILQNDVLLTAWIPFMASGIYLTPNIVYDCCKAEL